MTATISVVCPRLNNVAPNGFALRQTKLVANELIRFRLSVYDLLGGNIFRHPLAYGSVKLIYIAPNPSLYTVVLHVVLDLFRLG